MCLYVGLDVGSGDLGDRGRVRDGWEWMTNAEISDGCSEISSQHIFFVLGIIGK